MGKKDIYGRIIEQGRLRGKRLAKMIQHRDPIPVVDVFLCTVSYSYMASMNYLLDYTIQYFVPLEKAGYVVTSERIGPLIIPRKHRSE